MIIKIIKKELIFLFVLSFFIFLSSKALFHPGFFRTIDDVTTVRIIHMLNELNQINWKGNFPVRIASKLSHGYGYPLFLFYAPLTYYVGALIMLFLKLSHIVATKWIYVFPLIVGPIIFYWTMRQKMTRFPSLIASCFFTLFPYRGWNTYVRGGVGEAWAIAFLPGVFWGIFLMEKEKKLLGGLIFSFFLFLVIISHQLAALEILVLIFFYGIIFHLKNKEFWQFLILSLGLSSFYWLPALFYLKVVRVPYVELTTATTFKNLFPLSALIKINYKDPDQKIFGVYLYLLLIEVIFSLLHQKHHSNKNNLLVFFFGGIGILLYFLLSSISKVFWQITLPLTGIFQFPFRILVLLSFIIPFLTGLTIESFKNHKAKIGFSLIIIALLLTFLPIFKPKEYSFFYEYKAEGACATTTWADEYLPVWVKECAKKEPKNDIESNPKGDIKIFKNNLLELKATLINKKSTEVIVHRYYFPGWQILIDGKIQNINYNFSKIGIFKTYVSPGRHELKVFFSKTWIMWFADFLSLGSFFIFLTTVIFLIKKQKKFLISSKSATLLL